jgi:hypothetical protein
MRQREITLMLRAEKLKDALGHEELVGVSAGLL